MKIVICAKEVRDPDAVDNYVLHGRLEIGTDGKTLTQTSIPRLMNAYDEQAIEAALRLRDKGLQCMIHVISIGADPSNILRHAAALGADEIVHIAVDAESIDGSAAAALLAVSAGGLPNSGKLVQLMCHHRRGMVPLASPSMASPFSMVPLQRAQCAPEKRLLYGMVGSSLWLFPAWFRSVVGGGVSPSPYCCDMVGVPFFPSWNDSKIILRQCQ